VEAADRSALPVRCPSPGTSVGEGIRLCGFGAHSNTGWPRKQPHANRKRSDMDLTNRLNLETSFAVPAEKAADFLGTPDEPVQPSEVTDFHEPSGPMTRANTIRKRSDSHTEIAPLRDRDDLLERFTHPYVLEAVREAESAREAAEEEANVFRQSHEAAKVKQAEREVQQRREEIEQILERVRNGDTLDAAQLSTLIDRPVEKDAEKLTIRVTGREVTAETPELLGNMHGDRIGSSALWSAEDARKMYEALPVRILRRTASQIEPKPREAALGEHVESVGVEKVLEASDYFDRSEDSGETAHPDGPPQRDPRRHTRPQFSTTAAA